MKTRVITVGDWARRGILSVPAVMEKIFLLRKICKDVTYKTNPSERYERYERYESYERYERDYVNWNEAFAVYICTVDDARALTHRQLMGTLFTLNPKMELISILSKKLPMQYKYYSFRFAEKNENLTGERMHNFTPNIVWHPLNNTERINVWNNEKI